MNYGQPGNAVVNLNNPTNTNTNTYTMFHV